MQVKQRQYGRDLRAATAPREQDRTVEPLALAGLTVDPLVVDPRCGDLDGAGDRLHGAGLGTAVAHDKPVTKIVAILQMLGNVGIDLGLEGHGQHAARSLRGRSRRSRKRAPRSRPSQRLPSTLAFLPSAGVRPPALVEIRSTRKVRRAPAQMGDPQVLVITRSLSVTRCFPAAMTSMFVAKWAGIGVALMAASIVS